MSGEPIVLSDDVEAFLAKRFEQVSPHHSMNGYSCDQCGGMTMTIDVHVGVTPMFLGCRATEGCSGTGVSRSYPPKLPPEGHRSPEWEWARPDADAFAELSESMREHVLRGGLVLRPRTNLPGAYVVAVGS